jgi:hypothetical protein
LSIVHVVHCIDTEGPLHEPVEATFHRLEQIFGVRLEPSRATLDDLQKKRINLGGIEDEVAKVLAPGLLSYNDTWDKVDDMLRGAMSPAFRNQMLDSEGGGWVFNWHCLDIVGFSDNPRRRDMGFHNIFDHYREMLSETGSVRDGIHFHHHPIPFSGSAHHCATHYFSHNPVIYEILARRIIDRGWFPCVNRPGFHTTRPDSHWFLEQFVPFDYANQAGIDDYSKQRDLAGGRFGDWRRAPVTWTPYHPSYDDYQTPGSCRRWIARCLNLGTRLRLLSQGDVDLAFEEAAAGKQVVLAFTNHDFRDIRPDVHAVRTMLAHAVKRFPETEFKFCEAREAMRGALDLPRDKPIVLDLELQGSRLSVRTDRVPFGPQPFLAVKLRSGQYFHDNLDFQEPGRRWTYTFDDQSFPLMSVHTIGVATCDSIGNVSVTRLPLDSGRVEQLTL